MVHEGLGVMWSVTREEFHGDVSARDGRHKCLGPICGTSCVDGNLVTRNKPCRLEIKMDFLNVSSELTIGNARCAELVESRLVSTPLEAGLKCLDKILHNNKF